jgi:hypothetical protein
VESSCEFGIEPSGSIKCWETIKCPNRISRVVFSSIELVGYGLTAGLLCPPPRPQTFCQSRHVPGPHDEPAEKKTSIKPRESYVVALISFAGVFGECLLQLDSKSHSPICRTKPFNCCFSSGFVWVFEHSGV